ncbi:MAG TPA: CopD family protein [Symbiobacteriaceae bacterium]|nr:CopD family protein [Symbiobacteriaceae bacterium]
MLTYWAVLKWIHVVGAVIWMGGIFFVVFMLRPALAQLPEPHVRRFVLGRAVERMRRVMNVVVATQLLTGGYMAWTQLTVWDRWWDSPTGRILLAKIIVASVLISLYFIVPRLLLDKVPKGGEPVSCEDHAGSGGPTPKQKLGNVMHFVMMILGFTVIFLAKMLV